MLGWEKVTALFKLGPVRVELGLACVGLLCTRLEVGGTLLKLRPAIVNP